MTQDGMFTGTFSPRWLPLARAAWVLIAVTAAFLNVYGLVMIMRMTVTSCPFDPCYSYWQISPNELKEIQAAGLNLTFVLVTRGLSSAYSMLVWTVAGAVLFWRKSAEKPVYFVSLMLITLGSVAFGPLHAVDELNIPYLKEVARALYVIGQMSFVFFYIFPDGRFSPGWTRLLALFWAAVWAPAIFLRYYDPFDSLLAPPVFLFFIASVVMAQWARFPTIRDTLRRQQVKWVVYSTILAFSFFLVYLVVLFLFNRDNERFLFSILAELVLLVVMGGIPLSFVFAMLRYRLWDIDFLIRRTLAYGSVTVLLGVLYSGSVVLLQVLLGGLLGEESPAVIVVSTLAIAALFSPLYRRVQEIIDRRFYRQKYDAQRILENFSSAVRSEVNLEALTGRLLSASEETMQPEHIGLWIKKQKAGDESLYQ